MKMDEKDENKSWFAAKVFYNRTLPVVQHLDTMQIEAYCPSDVIPSLVFFKASLKEVALITSKFHSKLWIYIDQVTRKPSPIPDEEMELFIFVTSAGQKGMIYLGEDKPEYHQGDRVRVTDGPFKGAEGHIKRIKKDRRLVVTVRGVAAIATAYIHPSFLEKIEL